MCFKTKTSQATSLTRQFLWLARQTGVSHSVNNLSEQVSRGQGAKKVPRVGLVKYLIYCTLGSHPSIFLCGSFHNFATIVLYFHHILFYFISINQTSLFKCLLYN